MKLKTILFLIFVFGFLLKTEQIDASERLISLKPNITEIIFALEKGDELVGVTTYCDYPPQAKKIDKIADYVHVDVERVLAKKPTLVLGSEENSLKKEIEFLRSQGIRVELFPFGRLNDIADSLEKMGEALSQRETAHILAEKLRTDLKTIGSIRPIGPVKMIMILGAQPLVVAGSNNLFNDMMEFLGVTNPAGASQLRYPTFSTEQLIAAQPDILIDLSMGSETKKSSAIFELYKKYESIPAVKNKRIHTLTMSHFRPSERIGEGLKELAKIVGK